MWGGTTGRMMAGATVFAAVFAGIVLKCGAQTNGLALGSARDHALIQEGRYVYERNCLVCHGRWGDGKGEMAQGMWPRPRKFTSGVFKYRSTPSGSLPLETDLERTIRGGLYGTSMPTFQHLSDREVRAVIQYVQTFSLRWDRPQWKAAALSLPPMPSWWEAGDRSGHAQRGRELYRVSCVPCHGERGKGDGPAASGLEDQWGGATPPADLTQPSLRSGPQPQDLIRALLTGLDGTPMPSFRESLNDEQSWDLVAYLWTLRPANEPR